MRSGSAMQLLTEVVPQCLDDQRCVGEGQVLQRLSVLYAQKVEC